MLFNKYEIFIFNLQNFFTDIKNHLRWIMEPIVKFVLTFWLDVILFSIGKFGSGKLHLKIVEIYLNKEILFYDFEKHYKKFDKFLKMPLKKEIPDAYFLQGIVFLMKGKFQIEQDYSKDLEDAYENFQRAASLNSEKGYYLLYRMIDSNYIQKDVDKNVYLKLAAEQGSPNAQYELAIKILKEEKNEEGVFWIKKSLEQPKSKWLKMSMFFVTRNQVKKWYKKYHNLPEIKRKALGNDPKSLYEYSEYILNSGLSFNFGMEIHNLGVEYKRKSVEVGYPEAIFEEGCAIVKGWKKGTLKQGFEYISRAVENGYEKGTYVLGECFLYGIGTKQNYKNAKFYLTKGSNFLHTFFRLWNVNEKNIRKKIDGKKYLTQLRHFCN